MAGRARFAMDKWIRRRLNFVEFLMHAALIALERSVMKDQPNKGQSDNPLEDYAAEMSEALDGAPVELNETSAKHVEGGQVWMKNSAARSVQARALHLEESAAAFVNATSVDAHNGAIAVAVSQESKLVDVANSILVARHVETQNGRAAVLIAGRVDGEVKTLFTPMTALAAGAGFALTLLFVRQVLSRLNPFNRNRGA